MVVCPLNREGKKSHIFFFVLLSNGRPSVSSLVCCIMMKNHTRVLSVIQECVLATNCWEILMQLSEEDQRTLRGVEEWSGGGGGGRELEWPSKKWNQHPTYRGKRYTDAQSWLPVNTHESSSSSWNSTMRQL